MAGTEILVYMSAASPSLRPPARRTGLWVVGILLSVGALLAVYEYFVRTSSGQLLDATPLLAAHWFDHPLPPLNPENSWITALILVPPGVICLLLVLSGRKWVQGLIAVLMVVAANITTQTFKQIFTDRPDLGEFPSTLTQDYLSNSLPSGHTTMAASAAVAVFLLASPRQRPFAGLFAAVWAAGWGAYIFIEAWHRPSDMVAAYLVVTMWALLAGWLSMRAAPAHNSTIPQDTPVAAPAAGLSILIGLGLSLSALASYFFAGGWNGLLNSETDPSLWLWVAGALLAAGPAFLISGAGVILFSAEAGRHAPGAPVPRPGRRGESMRYPIPPEYRGLYESV